MKLAYISAEGRGETDRILSDFAAQQQQAGRQLAGIVKQLDHQPGYDNGCDMKVRVLPEGPVVQITQDLGQGSDACRLDPEALTRSVSLVEAGDLETADLFILNKFGPEEAAGRGFISAIGRAIEQEVPVLVGVGPNNRNAFLAFTGGLAEELAPTPEALQAWLG